ncbi:MAG: F510_1955 family glycosylhydrolase [Pedococcus sp.]
MSFALLISACSAGTQPPASQPGTMSGHSEQVGLPAAHVHAVARDPGTGSLLLATHEGLFRFDEKGRRERVGPIIDLMGFTIAGANHYYASGHPNVVMALPQPMGLIESTDGGKTWKVLSRGGESDFHALTRAGDTVVAFDGQLRRTTDGHTWETSSIPAPPRALASDPAATRVLATTERGLLLSTDQGATWAHVKGAPLLLLVAWADSKTVVGIAPDGAVAVSSDAAKTWRTTGKTAAAPQALSASMTTTGLEILVVTELGVLSSKDGATFTDATN